MIDSDRIITNDYFEWLCEQVCGERQHERVMFGRLLMHLHDVDFTYIIPKDINRAYDGLSLRRRFSLFIGLNDTAECLCDKPCSILEMMVALAIRCEESIMHDPCIGDRTGQWFWKMLINLGLGGMDNDVYNKNAVDVILSRFLKREYEPNGRGGLFRIRHCDQDLRGVEIWVQLCWYLDTIT